MTTPIAARPSRVAWLVLIYRLPAGSGLKAAIRRKLTAMGATYPVDAVAVLPVSPTAERAFRRLRNMIGQGGGSAQVLCAEAIEGKPDLITAFNATREQARYPRRGQRRSGSILPGQVPRGA